jgi:hypothetical protein
LSFASLVPELSDSEYAAMDEEALVVCWLCGGRGKRPVTAKEAEALGVGFTPEVVAVVPFDERPDCNGCSGSGRALPPGHGGSWHRWRIERWGTKWDATFDGPGAAVGHADADVGASVEAQGITATPEVAIYKFDTAWSPPIPFAVRASELFAALELTLRFGEPGGGFAGQTRAVAGLLIEDEELDLDDVLAPEEMWF